MRPLIVCFYAILFHLIAKLGTIFINLKNKFRWYLNPVDTVFIPILSFIIVYFEESATGDLADFYRKNEIKLDLISQLLIQPNYRFGLWCLTLIPEIACVVGLGIGNRTL